MLNLDCMAGDVVVGVNGRAITKGSDLIGAMDTLEGGQTVRDHLSLCMKLGSMPSEVLHVYNRPA